MCKVFTVENSVLELIKNPQLMLLALSYDAVLCVQQTRNCIMLCSGDLGANFGAL